MEWISIKDKLPDSDTYVLILLSVKFATVSYYFEDSFGKWWSDNWDIWNKEYTDDVT
ncbi:hypothetical protein LCGC14_1998090, partial [marine sediment metagenome]